MMAPEGVQAGLTGYGLGEKLRQLRHQRQLRLIEVAASSGLSPSLISKLESNKLFPTLPTLWRLAEAFNVGLDYFFSDGAAPSAATLVRASERPASASTNGKGFLQIPLLGPQEGKPRFHVSISEIAPGASIVGQHPGSEFLYVTEGELVISVEQNSYTVAAGDSFYFQSAAVHTYRNPGVGPCKLFLVTSGRPQEGL